MRERLLITGAAGRAADILIPTLKQDYDLILTDRRSLQTGPTVQLAELEDLTSLSRLCGQADLVLHLAADPDARADWDSLLPSNVVGTRNLLEAAASAGCRRVVLASSVQVALGATDSEVPLSPDVVAPASLYGATKAFAEALAFWYSRSHSISCLCLRLGWIADPSAVRPDHPELRLVITPRDLCQLVTAALRAPSTIKFGVFYGLSDNPASPFDLARTRRLLSYQPRDNAARLALGRTGVLARILLLLKRQLARVLGIGKRRP